MRSTGRHRFPSSNWHRPHNTFTYCVDLHKTLGVISLTRSRPALRSYLSNKEPEIDRELVPRCRRKSPVILHPPDFSAIPQPFSIVPFRSLWVERRWLQISSPEKLGQLHGDVTAGLIQGHDRCRCRSNIRACQSIHSSMVTMAQSLLATVENTGYGL